MIEYSIVTTVYNDELFVESFLDNILRQSYLPSEIVICDGGSQDGTIDVIEHYKEKSVVPIILISGSRLNIAQGFNEAIKHSNYDLIGIVATGNVYEDDFFEKLICGMNETNSDVEYSPIRGLNQNSFSQKYNNTLVGGNDGIVVPMASNHGSLIKKRVVEDVGYFYEGYHYAGEDSEFYIRVLQHGYTMNCKKDAILYWKTPCSLKEYFKQIKVYSISTLQGYSNLYLFRTWIESVYPFLLLVIIWVISKILFAIVFSLVIVLFVFKA
nr:glycosyltransferase [Clostridia bacterium]